MSVPVVLPDEAIPLHYDLDMIVNLDACEFTCDMSVDYDVQRETDSIHMHMREICIWSCKFVTSTSEELEAVTITENTKLRTVKFTFDKTLPIGLGGKLVINYKGILNNAMAGFYISNYTDAEGQKKKLASTQFEALDARRAFPCVDEPAMKATFTLSLTIPKVLTALSNMPESLSTYLSNGMKKVTFQKSPKMSTYLLAWAVGEVDCIRSQSKNGVSIGVYAPPGRAEQGRFALDVAVRSLDFYDEFFGVPYPLPKLDMICITEFAMGAMENWGLVTYREVDLMIDEKTASSQQIQRVATVVAHELAHQWFGNLVTMKWWDDLWLNEGFASYMENFCVNALFPDWKMWDQYSTGSMAVALRMDALRSSHPIQVPINHAEEVEQVFDAISYCKGSTAVRMAACILGPAAFQKGLGNYMQQHAYGNTVTQDLWSAWSAVSDHNMNEIMNSWTSQMGYPYIKVTQDEWTDKSITFVAEQFWFLSDGSELQGDEKKKLWTIPLLFLTKDKKSQQAVLLSAKKQKFSLPVSGNKNNFLKINAGQEALVRVSYSPAMLDRLCTAISDQKLGTVDRAAVLLDAYELARAGYDTSFESVVAILKSFKNELSHSVWKAINIVLKGLNSIIQEIGSDTYVTFKAFAATLVKEALDAVGWDASPGDGHSTKLLRTIIIDLLYDFCSSESDVIAEAIRRFEGHHDEPSLLPSDIRETVFKIVLRNGGKTEYDQVMTLFNSYDNNADKKIALMAFGSTGDKAMKTATLDWCVKSGQVKLQDFFYGIAGVTNSSREGAIMAWDYYKNNFEFFQEKLKKAIPALSEAAISYSFRFVTADKADELEEFFKKNPVEAASRGILKMVEGTRNSSKMLEKVKHSKLKDASFWALSAIKTH